MNSSLSGIPIPKRRRFAAILGLFAALFAAVGVVASTGTTPAVVRVFSAVALIVAVLLALVAWGTLHSVRVDLADQQLDAAIDEALADRGGRAQLCDCGHEHDPAELHITDACSHDGSGTECSHDCDTCVLAAPGAVRDPSQRSQQ